MDSEDKKKATEAAKEFSKLGASKGGQARALNLSPEERKEIAQKAIQARWGNNRKDPSILHATHGSPDRPLRIGATEIPCYVLENEMRVIAERGVVHAFGGKRGGAHWRRLKNNPDGAYLPVYLSANNLKPFISDELALALNNPIKFKTPSGKIAFGLEATLLPQICDVYLKARDAGTGTVEGKLHPSQVNIAKEADMLIRGLAQVGIIALIDEATGYQDDRTKYALQEIIERFIAKELQPWIRTFELDFYKEIFRLNNWEFNPANANARPGVIGIWTNDIIYSRLAPGVKDELHKLAERDEKGRPKHRLFQRLTDTIGLPKLKEHLAAVTALMKASDEWESFMELLNRALPAYHKTPKLPFKEEAPSKLKELDN